jgi:hypothetical protein
MLIIALAAPSAFAFDSKGAAYFGGTVTAFGSAKEPVEGTLDTTNLPIAERQSRAATAR